MKKRQLTQKTDKKATSSSTQTRSDSKSVKIRVKDARTGTIVKEEILNPGDKVEIEVALASEADVSQQVPQSESTGIDSFVQTLISHYESRAEFYSQRGMEYASDALKDMVHELEQVKNTAEKF